MSGHREGEANVWGNLSEPSDLEEVFVEEEADDTRSVGPDWHPTDADPVPHWGPPPPSPVSTDLQLSHKVSSAVNQAFLETGLPKSLLLTYIWPGARDSDKLSVWVKPMTPSEAIHPNALWTGSDDEAIAPPANCTSAASAGPDPSPRRRRRSAENLETMAADMDMTLSSTSSGPRGTAMLTTASGPETRNAAKAHAKAKAKTNLTGNNKCGPYPHAAKSRQYVLHDASSAPRPSATCGT